MPAIIQCASSYIADTKQFVYSKYDICSFLYLLCKIGKYKNEPIKPLPKSDSIDAGFILKQLAKCKAAGFLKEEFTLSGQTFYRSFLQKDVSVRELICCIDPFAYISHLSAMSLYSISEREPFTIFTTTPSLKEWNQLATAKMEKELSTYFDDYIKLKLPKLEKIKIESIKSRSVHTFSSNTPGKFKKMGDNLRVSKIGRTFLDMLRQPQLCGGINHVIEVFTNHAETYLQFIIDEIEKDGKPIDKVRAGYILEEECNIQHDIFEQWRQFKQRGSSRKLNASSDFDATKISTNWDLSINVF